MKEPYLQKFKKIGKYTVWIVNGNFIRTNIDIEFTNFGHHDRFPPIPKNEFWMDKEEADRKEYNFFIDNFLGFLRAKERGMSDNKAREFANAAEKKEREKSLLAKKALKKINGGKKIMWQIHKRKLNVKEIEVWIVNAEIVRDVFFIDFTEGGHDKVYSFIPSGEIWLDDDLAPEERNFVLLHELHERNLMIKGLGYSNAHEKASQIEFFARHKPKKMDLLIRKELKKITL